MLAFEEGVSKTPRKGAEVHSPAASEATLWVKWKRSQAPCKGKSIETELIMFTFALTGRGVAWPFTQGDALPFIHIFDNSQHLTFAEEIVKSCFESCISWT